MKGVKLMGKYEIVSGGELKRIKRVWLEMSGDEKCVRLYVDDVHVLSLTETRIYRVFMKDSEVVRLGFVHDTDDCGQMNRRIALK